MAIQSAKNILIPAKGNTGGTTPKLTPAPIHETEFGGEGQHDAPYGNNRYGGPSSDAPGQTTTSGFLPRDPVLDIVQAKGMRSDDASPINDQIRDIGKTNVPTHAAMARRGSADGSPGGTVPSKLGAVQANPVRQPGKAS